MRKRRFDSLPLLFAPTRALKITVLLLGILSVAGCDKGLGSKTADELSDDEVYRVIYRAGGADSAGEEKAVAFAHRVKDEAPLDYLNTTNAYRHQIKYYSGDEGTTTVDQYIAGCQAERAKQKAELDARGARWLASQSEPPLPHFTATTTPTMTDRPTTSVASQSTQLENLQSPEQVKRQKMADLFAKYDAEEKQLDADYGIRIKAIENDSSNPDRLEQARSLIHELSEKRADIVKQEREEEQKVGDASN
jgi:hypothetical protein